MNKNLILLSFTFLFFVNLSSQNTIAENSVSKKESRIWNQLKYDATSFTKGLGNAFTQPIRWKKDDLFTAAGVLGGTALLYINDTQTNKYFLDQNENAPNVLKEFGWYFGSPQNFFIISAGVYGFGLITDNEKIRYTGILIITSATASGILQSITKTVVGRSRPSNGQKNEFEAFSNEAGYHSFPSGHSILSFGLAHSIAKQFDNIWIKAGIYGIGAIAPISRLWANAHWLSDVGLGMALSIVIVDGVDNFFKKNNRYGYSKEKQISWKFKVGSDTIGVTGTF